MNYFSAILLACALILQEQGQIFVAGKIRTSEAMMSDGVQSDGGIPHELVGGIDVDQNDVVGLPLDPSDFARGEKMQNVNAPDIEGEDPIMSAKQYQGDIVISEDMHIVLTEAITSDNPQQNAILKEEQKWPNGVIPYAISSSYDKNERAVIAKAMKAFHDNTCIRFVPRNDEADYIYITKGQGCSSAVGRVGGGSRQPVSLGNGCIYFGIAIHELMHAAGFWHEHSRNDRDKFITIIENNIQPSMKYNFDKFGWDIIQDLGVQYDTQSIMHYGPYSFAIDRKKPTIIANNGDDIGQRTHLSDKDIKKLNTLYSCDTENIITVNPAPPENSCVDSSEFCIFWSQKGECDKNPAWMHNNCKKSCKKCEKQCKDDNVNCKSWANEGQCMNSPAYMTKHCRFSCGTCGEATTTKPSSKCEDKNKFCTAWASSGECRANPTYMLPNCKKSCKTC